MIEHEKYQHEDIEALLMSKTFSELLDEEKAYIMQHVHDEAEYTALRELLLQMHDLSFDSEMKDPPESLETALLHGFAENAEKVRGYTKRFAPWMAWAIAASVVGICLIIFWPFSNQQETAEVQPLDSTNQGQQSTGDSLSTGEAPKPVISLPNVSLPQNVESLFAQITPASTPSAPSIADRLYDYESDAVVEVPAEGKSVVGERPIAEQDVSAPTEEVLSTTSSAPTVAETKSVSLRLTEDVADTNENLQPAESSQDTRKRKRNPEAMNISQSKKLRLLLRAD